MCQICGQPHYVPCNCQVTQPFCDQCGSDNDCVEKMDAKCVFYHWKCDDPGRLANLDINCNTDLETILEKLDTLVGNSFNIPFEGQETPTIRWVVDGPAGHKPYAHVKISEDAGNIAEERPDGIYVPETEIPDPPDPVPPVFVDETNDCISIIVTTDEEGRFHITPSLDITCLLNKIRDENLAEFCALVDDCECLLSVENFMAVFAPACPDGYDLNGDVCEQVDVIPATPSGTTYELQVVTAVPWSKGGTILFKTSFNNDGSGPGVDFLADVTAGDVSRLITPNVWCNTTTTPFSGTETNALGPMNRCAVWADPYNASTTFVIPINVPSTGIYYIGLGVDNVGSIDVTYPDSSSANILTQDTAAGSAYYLGSGTWNFDYWNIYPITLQAGINYVSVSGNDSGLNFGIGMEIYDDTIANIEAAALDPAYVSDPVTFPFGQNHYSNLNLLFSTRCARQPGAITANSATCPATYVLDTTSGTTPTAPCQSINNPVANWTCVKVNQIPFSGYIASLVWDRIPTAVTYTVQQKLTVDPDASYVECVGSPVANPGSGTTVNLVVSGLTSDEMTFRVRANFDDCESEWTVLTP